jgi:hypothetical protein
MTRRTARRAREAPDTKPGRWSQLGRVAAAYETLGELRRLPRAEIDMAGDTECQLLYRAFTSRHPRLRLIQSKRWGVALLAIPASFEEYLRDPHRAHLRREYNRATRSGLSFARVDPLIRLDEVLAINRSAAMRQGQRMHPDYLDADTVRAYFERSSDVFGVLDAQGVLRAYLCLRVCGEVACVERLLGHADSLHSGVMWVLLHGVIRELASLRGEPGSPAWIMYDTFFGASAGMRQFKEWVGLEPYRVTWSFNRERNQ